ncbi:hypothetical protein M0R45_037356 [Rubus argutus]|uniref:Uncharacterized protein n=1 Tax=Rubus argutus TaxID=59490 RepID=A0AAW1VYW7_RUBAR
MSGGLRTSVKGIQHHIPCFPMLTSAAESMATFGTRIKAESLTGMAIAIKKSCAKERSLLGHKEWLTEVNCHRHLARPNLVELIGLGESSQWLEMCGDVGMVIFCVSLSDYDQFSADGNGSLTNKMLQSRAFFESIITHPTFELYTSDLGHRAYEYISVKFKRLYFSLTGKKLYVSMVEVFESYTVDEALKYSAEILKWDEVRGNGYFSDPDSFYSDSDSGSDLCQTERLVSCK